MVCGYVTRGCARCILPSTSARGFRWLAWALFCLLTVSACQSQPAASETPYNPSVQYTMSVPVATSTPSVLSVMATWRNNQYLDRTHLKAGLSCTSCHLPVPPKDRPGNKVCLGCHGGTYEAVAKLTDYLTTNPHVGCRGPGPVKMPCIDCHHVHQPFEYYCKICHRNFIDPERFTQTKSIVASNK